MMWIKIFWERSKIWLTKYGKYLILLVFAFVVVCYIVYYTNQRKADKAQIAALKLKLEVYKASAELYALESQREIMKLKQNYTKEEIKEIDKKIEETEGKICGIYKKIGDLSLQEKIDEYDRLGK